jgi:hypothetical protein
MRTDALMGLARVWQHRSEPQGSEEFGNKVAERRKIESARFRNTLDALF